MWLPRALSATLERVFFARGWASSSRIHSRATPFTAQETKKPTATITRKKMVRSGQAKIEGSGLTVADVENMDKATIQKMLMKYDLPTSGSISKLRERLTQAIS